MSSDENEKVFGKSFAGLQIFRLRQAIFRCGGNEIFRNFWKNRLKKGTPNFILFLLAETLASLGSARERGSHNISIIQIQRKPQNDRLELSYVVETHFCAFSCCGRRAHI